MEKLGISLVNHLENNAIVLWSESNQQRICETIKYKDLLKQVLKLSLFLEGEGVSSRTTVGIFAEKSYPLIALSLAVIEQSCAFCYLQKEDIASSCLNDLGVKYFFSDTQLSAAVTSAELVRNVSVCEKTFYFYKTKTGVRVPRSFNDGGDKMNLICFTITTSGTTGKPKIVRVTYNSIAPNIESLQNVFKLNASDVVLSSAPITFDVFVMDLFLALSAGAALAIVSPELRFDPFIFNASPEAAATSATFLQITPTVFQQYGIENIKHKIMHAQSRLKYLVLGGEKFPSTRDVITWQADWRSENRKRIFNIYGVTEMSCWSLIHEVSLEDLESGRVPLGTPLAATLAAYYLHNDSDAGGSNVEELILTSPSRVNFVDDKDWDSKLGSNAVFAYITNDLVERIDSKIYYYGRSDDLVKRFGVRVDLMRIEEAAAEITAPVACIMIKKKIALFYQAANSQCEELLANHLRLKLTSSEYPDDIKRIDFLPTCDHGKVSKRKLKELYRDILKEESAKQNVEEIFLEAINQIFNLKLSPPSKASVTDEPDGKRMRSNIDSTFKQIGGSSFEALRVAMKIEDKVELSTNGLLLPKLLDNRHSIKDIFTYLRELNLKTKDASLTPKALQAAPLSEVGAKAVKKFDLQKCVDSSPVLVKIGNKNFVAVGSHAGKVIVLDADKLSPVAEVTLGDRIECEASQYKDSILVGCYNGLIYCIDFLNAGKIKWTFDSGAMIKSKPLVVNDELIIFGNYNTKQNLWCIHVDENGIVSVKWSKMLGSSGIIAKILRLEMDAILVCTLDGTCERLDPFTGDAIWTKHFEYPIFSNPVEVCNKHNILIAEVMRKVHCIDASSGALVWSFETEGHIFSSFLEEAIENYDIKIIFGSHDKKLRCLNHNESSTSPTIEWETELQSQVYGTPNTISINGKKYVVSCSTNGYVNLIDQRSGSYENSFKLPGEIFSSPLVYKNTIFVGCRDNFVYCINIE